MKYKAVMHRKFRIRDIILYPPY